MEFGYFMIKPKNVFEEVNGHFEHGKNYGMLTNAEPEIPYEKTEKPCKLLRAKAHSV